MKDTTTKADVVIRVQAIRNRFICLILLISLALVYSCKTPCPNPYSIDIAEHKAHTPSGGIITSQYSDSPVGSDISKIVDNNKKTLFITPHRKFYILWRGDKSEPFNHYSLTSATSNPSRDPRSWTLSGSLDNKTWTLLDKQKNQRFADRGETINYPFENKVPYKYYKLEIEENGGDESTQIAEWRMEMIWTDIEDLMKYSVQHYNSDLTPMGMFFENRHVTTEKDRLWLIDPQTDAPLHPGEERVLIHHTVNLYPSGSPTPSDANQKSIGNCSAIAVFASMAYSYPEFVKSLIKENEDGTYMISMFDPQGEPVKVTVQPTFLTSKEGHIQVTTGKNHIPSWATVLEKALTKYNYIYKISRNYDLAGIGTEHVLPLFTGNGNSFAFAQHTLNAKDLSRAVNVCLKQGIFVLGSFNTWNLPVDGSTTITGHVYSFMVSPDDESLFLMRNPYGNNPNVGGEKDGMLVIKDDGIIPQTIDIRIVEPGIAAKYPCEVIP